MQTYPLLQSQMGVYLEWVKDTNKTKCNIPIVAKFGKNIDKERLEKAIQCVFKVRKELHIQICVDDKGEPRQWSDPTMTLPIERKMMSEEEVLSYIQDGFVRPFNLFERIPLIHTEIIETEEFIYWLWDPHHIIIDGTTHEPHFFQEDITAAYNGELLSSYEYGLLDHAVKEQASFSSELYEKSKKYYHERFKECVAITLAEDFSQPWGNCIRSSAFINKDLINQKCAEIGISSNLLFMGAFSIVLSRLSRENKVVFYTINHGRNDRLVKHVYGMFVKSTPILAEIEDDIVASDFVKSLRAELNASIRHGIYPFTHFCKDLNINPTISFGFQGDSLEEVTVIGGNKYQIYQPSNTQTDKDISCIVYVINNDYDIRIEASDGLYDVEFLSMLANAIKCITLQILSNPTSKLKDLSLINKEEQQLLLNQSRGRIINYDNQETFVSLFNKQVEVHGESIAIVCGEESYTYVELDRVSNIIANRLHRLGVKQGDFVAITLNRCKEFIASIIGVLKAGGAYVPIDINYPEERKYYIVSNCKAKCVISQKWITDLLSTNSPQTVETQHIDNSSPELPAYMIYTSGTTGNPKGVIILHKNIVACSAWLLPEFNLEFGKKNLLHPNFSFDASTFDLFYPLIAGSEIHIVEDSWIKDVDKIAGYISEKRITGMTLSTAIGLELLRKYNPKMDYMMLGGEKFINQRSIYNSKVYNGYGPTEFTVCSSFKIVNNYIGKTIPIGVPVPNSYSLIYDQSGHLLPFGAVGELCLSGPQLSKGYHNNETLTNNRYVNCNDVSFGLMYKTGDLARYNKNGELEYVGRVDNQIKINGYRIELEEIEQKILSCYGIINCLVFVGDIYQNKGLICLYISDKEIDNIALGIETKSKLPSYMVPDIFIRVEKFNFTPNGKIDRKKPPSYNIPIIEVVKPRTEYEQILTDVISEISQIDKNDISINTKIKFYNIGSLKQSNIVNLLLSKYHLNIKSSDCSVDETIENIASKITKIRQNLTLKKAKLTSNQLDVYVESKKHEGTTMYNVPLVMQIADCKAARVKLAIESCIKAHPLLLAHVSQDAECDYIEVSSDTIPNIQIKQLSEHPSVEFFQKFVYPFDLDFDILSRFILFEYSQTTYLFFDIHHIITDGYSEQILIRDIIKELEGHNVIKEYASAFDFALTEEKYRNSAVYEEDRIFYNTYLDEAISAVFPKDEIENSCHQEKIVKNSFCDDKIKHFCKKFLISENDLFLTLFTQYLLRFTNENKVVINTVYHGRTEGVYSNTLGMFVRTLPFVAELHKNLRSALLKTQLDVKSVRTHCLYPLHNIYNENGISPEVLFSFDAELNNNIKGTTIKHSIKQLLLETPKTPFSISVSHENDNYEILIEYDEVYYKEVSMINFIKNFITYILETIKQEEFPINGLVTQNELHDIIKQSYGGSVEPVRDTIVKRIIYSSQRYGSQKAIIDKNGFYTYSELNNISNNLANELISNNIGRGDYVAIILGHRKDFVASLIGVLKSGGGYVPLDSSYPISRIQYCLKKCSIKSVITSKVLYNNKLKEVFDNNLNYIFVEDLKSDKCPNVDNSSLSCIAYIIFTSGSTGEPKGVMISNKALSSFTQNIVQLYNLNNADKILCHSSYGFDASVEDIFPILTVGGELHCVKSEDRIDTEAIANYIIRNRITGGCYSTQFGQAIIQQYPKLPLKYLTVGGEKMLIGSNANYEVYNTYGPTEFTVDATYYKLLRGKKYKNIPIGKPMAGTYALILDQDGNLLPQGGIGCLHLNGNQIASGYINDEKQTESKFKYCKYVDGIVYDTGDLVRKNGSGQLEFIGRHDHQVKIRGFRIEIGEIETSVKTYPHIKETIVFVSDKSGLQRLCCFYTTDIAINKSELKDYLCKRLPIYMVPSIFVEIDEKDIKYTASGKINRNYYQNQCLIPYHERKVEFIPPTNEIEAKICHVFKEFFNSDEVGIDDHYQYDLGGNSISPTYISALCKKQGVNISVQDVFSFGTPRKIASFLQNGDFRATNTLLQFDDKNIKRLLKNQLVHISNFSKYHTKYLLTGATGFLGMHILYNLLKMNYNVCCVVRSKEKLVRLYKYYFNKELSDYQDKLNIHETDYRELRLDDINADVSCIINCAANVKHYVSEDEKNEQQFINVNLVCKLVEYCSQKKIELIHISTVSIAGESTDEAVHFLTEEDFFIGQISSNNYVTTKYNAEGFILEKIASGQLCAKIIRLGNLSARYSDGIFQINESSNAFINYIRSITKIGCVNSEQYNMCYELSPVDLVSEAIVKIANLRGNIVYHLYNSKKVHMQLIIKVINKFLHKDINFIDNDSYEAVIEKYQNKNDSNALQGILHYESHGVLNDSTNGITTKLLRDLNFEWPEIEETYFERLFMNLQNPLI